MKLKKILALILSVVALISFAGCGNKKTNDDASSNKLSWWIAINSVVGQSASNYGEIPLYKEVQKQTGIEIDFVHPVVGQETQQFNIMVASGEFPDIITYDITNYNGGAVRAIDDKVIIPLNDLMEKHAPNLTKVLSENPQWDKAVKLDDGTYFTVPMLYGDETLMCWSGPQIRKDLLDKANLPVPETIEEWDTTLRAFKKMGIEAPFSLPKTISSSAMFVGAFGVNSGYYQDNGVVKYGEIEPGFKEFLTLISGWYKDGLLDKEYFVQDGKTYDSKVSTGKVGAFVSGAGGGMGKFIPALEKNVPGSTLVAAPFPVMNKGDIPEFGFKTQEYNAPLSSYISTKCANPELAMKLLDFGFSEKGHMVYNFGTEGESYEMIDGYPTYTELITNNPDGMTMPNALGIHCGASIGGPFVQDKRYYEQYLQMPQQKEAVKIWANQNNNHILPALHMTAQESAELLEISNTLKTYVDENVTKFIIGQRPMSQYDKFVEELKSMGIEKGIAVYQAALDRYNKR